MPDLCGRNSTARSFLQPSRHQPQPDRSAPRRESALPGTAARAQLGPAATASTQCRPVRTSPESVGRATVRAAGDMISLAGELDLATSDDIADRLRQALQAYETGSTVIVDLAQTEFIDARGCAALVSAYRTARERDLTLKLINARPIVAKVITLCRLHEAPSLTAAGC